MNSLSPQMWVFVIWAIGALVTLPFTLVKIRTTEFKEGVVSIVGSEAATFSLRLTLALLAATLWFVYPCVRLAEYVGERKGRR